MIKEYLMLSTLAFSTFYKIAYYFSDKDEGGRVISTVGFWLNDKVVLATDTWVWFLFEHVNMVFFAVIMALPGQVSRGPAVVFIGIYIVDLVNFMIHYDDPFVNVSLPWNVAKIFVFLLAIFNEKVEWKK